MPVLLVVVLSRRVSEPLLLTSATPPDCETKKQEGGERRGRERRKREEQAKERISRRKDNVNVKNLSKIRNSMG